MSIHEECGVFGLFSPRPIDAANTVCYGLHALQHRGQESCGIVCNDDGVFVSHKDLGLVGDVFSAEVLKAFPPCSIAIGHVRYATTGVGNRSNCQPLEVNHQKGSMAIAHNGNLSNADVLRDELELSGAIFHTTSDTETIAYLATRERLSAPSIEEALARTMDFLEGAYSLIVMSAQKLVCVRDPQGFHPLCIGKTPDDAYVIASESCALSAVGATFVRDIEPGEIVIFGPDGVKIDRRRCKTKPLTICSFEHIYFARPDSVIDGVCVHSARVESGRILARTHPVEADVVVGVPDSGLDAALGYSEESGIAYRMGLIKNKYVGRTFIAPSQDERLDKVRIKLSAIAETVRGKRVVLVDDSIVRGTTSARIVALLREAGAAEVHLRISAPPFLHACYYGTDVDSEENLVARGRTAEEIAQIIGADSLGYLPIESLDAITGGKGCCRACFDGNYPTPIPANTKKNRFETKLGEKNR